jgi:HNH endonuclease
LTANDLTKEQKEEARGVLSRMSQPVPFCGCELWLGPTIGAGYGQARFGGKSWYAHRLSFQIAKGVIPKTLCVMHKCDTRLCINPSHLTLGSHKDNTRDMHLKGRGRAKLSHTKAREVRKRVSEGCRLRDLAIEMRINYFTLWNASRNRTWKEQDYDAK